MRNKYCSLCAFYKRKEIDAPSHKCYKNWSGTSSAMEADIIVEGFCNSIRMYGVKYVRMIGDGDSNVYKKILDARPYNNITVEKIECKNHLLRNFCNKLKDIVKDSKLGNIKLRKILGSNILRLRNAVTKAAEYRRDDDISKLKEDIMNAPRHVLGQHDKCQKYFCKGNTNNKNYMSEFENTAVFYKLMDVVGSLACHAKSLKFNANNNSVECFNAIIAKHIGGKRVNFSLKRSYQTRCNVSVLTHNSKTKYRQLHKELENRSPGYFCKSMEKVRSKRRRITKSKKFQRRVLFPDASYGPNAQKPDMPLEEFCEKKNNFLKSLQKSELQRKERQFYRRIVLSGERKGENC